MHEDRLIAHDSSGALICPLKLLRDEKGVTQNDLSWKLGLLSGGTYIGHIEQAAKKPARKLVYKIAELFKVDAHSFEIAMQRWVEDERDKTEQKFND